MDADPCWLQCFPQLSSLLYVIWVVDHSWYTKETVESEKPSSVAVLDTLKPVRPPFAVQRQVHLFSCPFSEWHTNNPCCFICVFVFRILLLAWVILCGRQFHVVMALCSTVCFPKSVLDLGTVKRHLVACLGCLSVSCLNREFGVFNTSIPLKDKSWCSQSLDFESGRFIPCRNLFRDFESGEIDMHAIDISPLCTFKGQLCCSVLVQL